MYPEAHQPVLVPNTYVQSVEPERGHSSRSHDRSGSEYRRPSRRDEYDYRRVSGLVFCLFVLRADVMGRSTVVLVAGPWTTIMSKTIRRALLLSNVDAMGKRTHTTSSLAEHLSSSRTTKVVN